MNAHLSSRTRHAAPNCPGSAKTGGLDSFGFFIAESEQANLNKVNYSTDKKRNEKTIMHQAATSLTASKVFKTFKVCSSLMSLVRPKPVAASTNPRNTDAAKEYG